MFKKTLITLLAAHSLASASTAQAGSTNKTPPPQPSPPPIPISSLPFVISAPGTYVLTGNLSYSDTTNTAAIKIQTDIQGTVTVDLQGFTLTGNAGSSIAIGIGYFAGSSVPNSFPIIIQNGTINNFGYGVEAGIDAIHSVTQLSISKLNINTTATSYEAGIILDSASFSTINNCSFNGGSYGIEDLQSPGGNSYANNTFKNTAPIVVSGQNGGVPTVLNSCSFNGPPTN